MLGDGRPVEVLGTVIKHGLTPAAHVRTLALADIGIVLHFSIVEDDINDLVDHAAKPAELRTEDHPNCTLVLRLLLGAHYLFVSYCALKFLFALLFHELVRGIEQIKGVPTISMTRKDERALVSMLDLCNVLKVGQVIFMHEVNAINWAGVDGHLHVFLRVHPLRIRSCLAICGLQPEGAASCEDAVFAADAAHLIHPDSAILLRVSVFCQMRGLRGEPL